MPRSMALWICITENLIEAATMWSMWLLSGHFMKRQTEGKGLWLVKNNTWQSKELWALLLLYKPVKSTPAPSSCDVVQIHYTITFHPFFFSILLLWLPTSNWGKFYCTDFCSGGTSDQLLMVTHGFLCELRLSETERKGNCNTASEFNTLFPWYIISTSSCCSFTAGGCHVAELLWITYVCTLTGVTHHCKLFIWYTALYS